MSIFNNILVNRQRTNAFDLSHEKKLTMSMGRLVPIMCQEVLPGDKFKASSEIFIRLQPLLSPVMHRVNVYTHYFFVPNRLIWDSWEEFITGGEDGLSQLTPPQIRINSGNYTNFGVGSLADYLGVPAFESDPTNNIDINALPFRAYAKIYNDYYRDQNLQEEIDLAEDSEIAELRFRAWEKDYFTSALPWAQKGGEVTLPLGGTAPIQLRDDITQFTTNILNPDGTAAGDELLNLYSHDADTGGATLHIAPDGTTSTAEKRAIDNSYILEADLTTATATTINDLRRAARLQEWLERNARAGSRYIEQIFSHFGVKSSDARLQRPEYLGGAKKPVVISEVLSSVALEGQPQGTMTGHGVSVGKSNRFKRRFEEHGFIIGIMSVVPRTAYQQGLNKMFFRNDKLNYYWPEFAQLGEQAVQNKELYFDPVDPAAGEETFGYQSRYAEYKYNQSTVHGEMRTTYDFWHMGRIFGAAPSLNSTFIEALPTERIFAVQQQDTLIVQIFNSVQAQRPIPYFNTPTL